ncbi:MAG: 16S rRNA (guanine(966)-N(2))-methyltransferase RsmD [Chlamydiae bacterium RIFCSPHIGHO2_12_FULL_27_8]|nr:MAG: 16S rRNA (guanine(966)-N(2))-methyltransferase RsmD [Chlamydiae bacterium RIFCSPHIGHO2_12_FULL_27_8]
MSLRIVSGIFKNRPVKAPKNIRPATSNLRDALFNISYNIIQDANVLDIFAGSGANGIEAISRGAKFATFIDASKESIKFIYQNISDFNIQDQTRVILKDAFSAVSKLFDTYDIIIIDPPFILFKNDPEYVNKLIEKIFKNNLLSKDGILFIEEPTYSKREKNLEFCIIKDDRKYGSAILTQYIVK